MRMRIATIVCDGGVQVRRRLDRDAVLRYADAYGELGPDALPAVTLFDTEQGVILADGFHRLAAARAVGLTELTVDMRPGTWDDAYEYAVTANTAHGVPLDRAARAEAVRRIKRLHPDWGHRRIAKAVGCGTMTVSRILAAQRGPRSAVPVGTDPLTTLDLLRRLDSYGRDLTELLAPGARYVARRIAQLDDPWADTPGSRTPARWAERIREHEAGLREVADELKQLASQVDSQAQQP